MFLLHRLLSSWEFNFPSRSKGHTVWWNILYRSDGIWSIYSKSWRNVVLCNCIECVRASPNPICSACSVLGAEQSLLRCWPGLERPQGLGQHQQVSREKSTQVAPTCADHRETIIQRQQDGWYMALALKMKIDLAAFFQSKIWKL